MTRRRLILGAALVAAVVVGVGIYAYEKEKEPIEKRGSASEEFVTTEAPQPPPPKKTNPRPWPTYGYNVAREHISPYDHRPPFRRLWKVAAHERSAVNCTTGPQPTPDQLPNIHPDAAVAVNATVVPFWNVS